MLLAKGLFPKLLISGPNFVGQILLCPVCNFGCKLLTKFDQMSIFWTLVTKVTSDQLFMHKNAWHWTQCISKDWKLFYRVNVLTTWLHENIWFKEMDIKKMPENLHVSRRTCKLQETKTLNQKLPVKMISLYKCKWWILK